MSFNYIVIYDTGFTSMIDVLPRYELERRLNDGYYGDDVEFMRYNANAVPRGALPHQIKITSLKSNQLIIMPVDNTIGVVPDITQTVTVSGTTNHYSLG